MVSDEKLLDDLREFADELGKIPTATEMKENGSWSDSTYQNHFGSWNNALEATGLEKNTEKNISDDRLICDLQGLAEKLGRTPTREEMSESGPWSYMTYNRAFGSWNNALENAELEINILSPSERAGTGEQAYGRGYLQKRAEAYERDNYECRVCGDGEKINCHHIKPRRTFDDVSDSNTLDNLITLCPSCHMSFEGRWQDTSPDEFAEKARAYR